MSQEFTESTAPLTTSYWASHCEAWKGVPSIQVDERIALAKAGDREAIESLISAHYSSVYRICVRMMGGREDAQDATQEAFIRMVRFLPKYDSNRPFIPWLYSISMNAFRDQLRKRKRHRTEPIEYVADTQLVALSSVEHQVSINEDLAVLQAGLRTLSEKERAVIVLRDIEGMSTRDVAQTMGTKEETVRSQISRARVKLKAFRDAVRRDES